MYDFAANGQTEMKFHLGFHKVDFHPVPPAWAFAHSVEC